jgi:hypothetical protein
MKMHIIDAASEVDEDEIRCGSFQNDICSRIAAIKQLL